MKNKGLIIVVSFLAVAICLILIWLLLSSATPTSLVILAFIIGIFSGACILALIINLRNILKIRRQKKEK
jgi:multisubunit Na+/H+ antiporter MnhE subunit